MYNNSVWAPVAATGNLTALATVVCRQLNYSSGIASGASMYATPQSTGQLSFFCRGGEAALSACKYGGLVGGYSEVEVACATAGGACMDQAQKTPNLCQKMGNIWAISRKYFGNSGPTPMKCFAALGACS